MSWRRVEYDIRRGAGGHGHAGLPRRLADRARVRPVTR